MHEALERREAHHGTPRATALEPDHAPAEIEDHEHSQHAQDGNAADPPQPHITEFPPIAAGGLYEHAGTLIGNADAPLDPVQLLQELLLLDRTRGRIHLLGN